MEFQCMSKRGNCIAGSLTQFHHHVSKPFDDIAPFCYGMRNIGTSSTEYILDELVHTKSPAQFNIASPGHKMDTLSIFLACCPLFCPYIKCTDTDTTPLLFDTFLLSGESRVSPCIYHRYRSACMNAYRHVPVVPLECQHWTWGRSHQLDSSFHTLTVIFPLAYDTDETVFFIVSNLFCYLFWPWLLLRRPVFCAYLSYSSRYRCKIQVLAPGPMHDRTTTFISALP